VNVGVEAATILRNVGEPLIQQHSIISQRTHILRFYAVNGNIDRCVAVDGMCTAV
jgi:hypothetical protein